VPVCPETIDLFDPSPIAGLRYQDAFLTEQEEPCLIEEIAGQNLSPFRFQKWTGKRLTETFGWSYDFEKGTFGRADPIPDFLLPIRRRAAQFASLFEKDLEQALLIRYDTGAGIGWHRDRPVFENVVGISLGSEAAFAFRRRREKGFDRVKLPLKPRSIYLLSGEARHDWEHGIDRHDAPRWSITFRSLSAKGRARAKLTGEPAAGG
jgi:alkylated DNA repair dioxygenase AlkB